MDDSRRAAVDRGAILDDYTARVAGHRVDESRYDRLDQSIGNSRVVAAIAVVACVFAWLVFHALPAWWIVVPLAAFFALAVYHPSVDRPLERARRLRVFYEQGVKRMTGVWPGSGNTGSRFADPNHPYAVDIDIFGRASLFELLCTARTRAGEACVAKWLNAPADRETILGRQEAIAELTPRLELRERLALLGGRVSSSVDPNELLSWSRQPARAVSSKVRLSAFLLAAAVAGGIVAWACGKGPYPLGFAVIAAQIFAHYIGIDAKQINRAAERALRDLNHLGGLLAVLERENFRSPALESLQNRIAGGEASSIRIARLRRIVDLLSTVHNEYTRYFSAVFLGPLQIAFAIEAWRAQNGMLLSEWFSAIGEFEALSSLASFAYENPDYPFPEIVADGSSIEANAISHPLLPVGETVGNDVQLSAGAPLYIVSGSNMSGKSTLLRTIGVNAVLALAGAPVRARRMKLSVLQVGASIRTLDSLEAGVSRFYAEISRLRTLVEIAGGQPLLFLLDEILGGTNSHDRLIGAQAVVRTLVERGAIGLITTHDLALTQMASDPAMRGANVHFSDELVDGRLSFDYTLHPGVVTHSNAIELMRSVGLDV